MKKDIKSMLLTEISEYIESIGEPRFRAKQIYKWLRSGIISFSAMTNLPEKLRKTLEKEFYIPTIEIVEKQFSKQDETTKYLLKMHDGCLIESVVMVYEHGNTICISTQVGCRMGCIFCASTLGGLIRDLESSEMEGQIMLAQKDTGKRMSNVVLMGIGEPLDNIDNTKRFLEHVNHPDGLNIGMRHITLSTCGIIENIDKMGEYNLQLTLSVSLHAPDDETRSRIMPVNRTSGVDALLAACDRYYKNTGRRVTFEYALIDGINDTQMHAKMLAEKLEGRGSHVNIILLNDVEERTIKASKAERVRAFTNILSESGQNYTIRRKLGGDIAASCGQLRSRYRS